MTRWQPIETAPYDTPVAVKAGRMHFGAILRPGASMTENGVPCDQWRATGDRFPKNWSEGACWESNADEMMSDQPTAWRPFGARS